jgi:transposase
VTAHDDEAVAVLLRRLLELRPALVVLEATGGLQPRVATELAAAGLPVAVVNPRQVRDFARATGRLAKTDRLDAETIARFAEAVRPPARRARGPLHGRPHRHPLQSPLRRRLLAAARAGQAGQGRPDRVHAQAGRDPQRHAPRAGLVAARLTRIGSPGTAATRCSSWPRWQCRAPCSPRSCAGSTVSGDRP